MVATHPAPHLRLFNSKRHSPRLSLDFELVEQTDFLSLTLSSAVTACANCWRLSHSFLGIIPANSIGDKCPYRRSATLTSTSIPPALAWVLQAEAEEAKAHLAEELEASSRAIKDNEKHSDQAPGIETLKGTVQHGRKAVVRAARRWYPRDSVTKPAMIPIYNILLMLTMFRIDISASSL